MIKKDVVNAVKDGTFTVYPVERVEEGLEILTGMPAGQLQEDGTYPEGTVHYLVSQRLKEITQSFKEKKDKEKEEENDKEENDS
jgi:predicted ATP-dependent protease